MKEVRALSIDDLLSGITPEHGIPDDFIEAVRSSHSEGLEALAAEHNTALEAAAAASAAAIEALNAAHAAEIERVRAEKFEDVLDVGDTIDSVGNDSLDSELTIESYWEEVN